MAHSECLTLANQMCVLTCFVTYPSKLTIINDESVKAYSDKLFTVVLACVCVYFGRTFHTAREICVKNHKKVN